jgi:Protein of unknown function (DUF3606)
MVLSFMIISLLLVVQEEAPERASVPAARYPRINLWSAPVARLQRVATAWRATGTTTTAEHFLFGLLFIQRPSAASPQSPQSPQGGAVLPSGRDGMKKLTKSKSPDRSKINLHRPREAKCWAHEFGISMEELSKLVEKVGNAAAAVRKELAT